MRAEPMPTGRFAGVLLLSMAVHALLLARMAGPAQPLPSPERLLAATLRLVTAPVVAAAAPASPRSAPSAVVAHRPAPLPASKSGSVASARPAPPEVGQPPAPVEARPVSEALAAARPTIGMAPADSAPAAPVAARPDQQTLLGRYAQQLSRLLASHQEYPRLAALRGWEGEVRLRLKVARQGNLLSIQVDRSSGYDILDQHAVHLVDLASRLPPLPDELEGSEIQILVPVNYKLKKTT